MQKIKLNVDSLRVESFTTANAVAPRGTVRALDASQWAETCGDSCGCQRLTDGCTIGCWSPESEGANNCGTVIEY